VLKVEVKVFLVCFGHISIKIMHKINHNKIIGPRPLGGGRLVRPLDPLVIDVFYNMCCCYVIISFCSIDILSCTDALSFLISLFLNQTFSF